MIHTANTQAKDIVPRLAWWLMLLEMSLMEQKHKSRNNNTNESKTMFFQYRRFNFEDTTNLEDLEQLPFGSFDSFTRDLNVILGVPALFSVSPLEAVGASVNVNFVSPKVFPLSLTNDCNSLFSSLGILSSTAAAVWACPELSFIVLLVPYACKEVVTCTVREYELVFHILLFIIIKKEHLKTNMNDIVIIYVIVVHYTVAFLGNMGCLKTAGSRA